jgi:hypothetical protein
MQMMRVLTDIRSFIKPDTLKFMRMQALTCILIKEERDRQVGDDPNHREILTPHVHVFDRTGVYIGTIETPHYIPDRRGE